MLSPIIRTSANGKRSCQAQHLLADLVLRAFAVAVVADDGEMQRVRLVGQRDLAGRLCGRWPGAATGAARPDRAGASAQPASRRREARTTGGTRRWLMTECLLLVEGAVHVVHDDVGVESNRIRLFWMKRYSSSSGSFGSAASTCGGMVEIGTSSG